MSAVAVAASTPARPAWAIGRPVPIEDMPARYHDALRAIAWTEGDEPGVAVMVPQWAGRVCGLSRRGRSPQLRAWLEWCAAGGADAEHRALLIQNLARLMPPDEALRAIRQMIGGT